MEARGRDGWREGRQIKGREGGLAGGESGWMDRGREGEREGGREGGEGGIVGVREAHGSEGGPWEWKKEGGNVHRREEPREAGMEG